MEVSVLMEVFVLMKVSVLKNIRLMEVSVFIPIVVCMLKKY
jgi:hypothetical protein